MLIPLRHENMQGRRWPVITIGVITLNLAIFLITIGPIERQGPELGTTKLHVLLLAAMHPELNVPESARQMVNTVEAKNPTLWKAAQQPNREIVDPWDARIRQQEDPDGLQQEMNSLANRLAELDSVSILSRYAYTPAHPTALSMITANFLHGGWLHVIGNMWFLWLAGAVLEDTWGRAIYPSFYLLAGILALQVHGMVNAGSLTPTIGASGAIAGLMGAFLVRFPTTKIEMCWLLFYRLYRFKVAAYWLLPLWLVTEIFYGSLSGQTSGVAHWAHIGGFVFGGLIAVGIQKSGLEQIAEQGIQSKVSWVSHPLLVDAGEQIDKEQFAEAESTLKKLLVEMPDSIDAYRMLQNVYWRRNDLPAQRAAVEKILELEVKAKDPEAAWQTYQDFKNAGGETLSASIWLDLCRQIDPLENQSRAAELYEDLAKAWPSEKQGLLAQMAAGRIYLKRLNRPADALRCYQAAAASTVPHGDWVPTIDRGIEEARKAPQPQVADVIPNT